MSETVYALGGTAYRRYGDDLYDPVTGRHVGRFRGSEVYAPSGTYLGELTETGRLGTRTGSRGKLGPASPTLADRGATGNAAAMPAGVPDGFEAFDPKVG